MSLDDVLASGRAAALALMTDTCWVRRGGALVTNPTTGAVTPAWTDVYGTQAQPGRCRVQDGTGSGDVEAAEHRAELAGLVVSLPITATGVRPGDQVVMATSAHDPDLVGRVLTVTRVLSKSHATARRLWCEEVQS